MNFSQKVQDKSLQTSYFPRVLNGHFALHGVSLPMRKWFEKISLRCSLVPLQNSDMFCYWTINVFPRGCAAQGTSHDFRPFCWLCWNTFSTCQGNETARGAIRANLQPKNTFFAPIHQWETPPNLIHLKVFAICSKIRAKTLDKMAVTHSLLQNNRYFFPLLLLWKRRWYIDWAINKLFIYFFRCS